MIFHLVENINVNYDTRYRLVLIKDELISMYNIDKKFILKSFDTDTLNAESNNGYEPDVAYILSETVATTTIYHDCYSCIYSPMNTSLWKNPDGFDVYISPDSKYYIAERYINTSEWKNTGYHKLSILIAKVVKEYKETDSRRLILISKKYNTEVTR